MVHVFALILVTVLALPGSAIAQDESVAVEPEVTLAEVVEGIAATNAETNSRIERLVADLDLATLEIEGANIAFDGMIETLRLQASVGAPDSEFIANLEKLERMATEDAAAAKIAGHADFEEAFLEDAEVFSEQRGKLIGEYEALERRIRMVESERERVVFMIKLRRYDEAQELVGEASEIIAQGAERISQVERALRHTEEEPIEN